MRPVLLLLLACSLVACNATDPVDPEPGATNCTVDRPNVPTGAEIVVSADVVGTAGAVVSFGNGTVTTVPVEAGRIAVPYQYTTGGAYTVRVVPTGGAAPGCSIRVEALGTVSLVAVEVLRFPFTQPNGVGWDGGGANETDAFFVLADRSDAVVLDGESDERVSVPGVFADVESADLPLLWTVIGFSLPLSSFDSLAEFRLMDADGGEGTDDLVARDPALGLDTRSLTSNGIVYETVTNDDATLQARLTFLLTY